MRLKNSLVLVSLLFLCACSPHPGAGGWRATSGDAAFERLEVQYDGRADFYVNAGDKDAAWRCFWARADERAVGLKCANAADPDKERLFQLVVDEGGQEAVLNQDDNIMGRYAWQPPTDP